MNLMGNIKHSLKSTVKSFFLLFILILSSTPSISQMDCSNIPCLDVEYEYLSSTSEGIYDGTPLSIPCEGTLRIIGRLTGGVTPIAADWTFSMAELSGDAALDIMSSFDSGEYLITHYDADNDIFCQCKVDVQEASIPTLGSFGKSNVSCNGENDGEINITADGGIPPYSYIWTNGMIMGNGQLTGAISGLSAGSYNISVVDDLGCSFTQSATITEPSPLIAEFQSGNIQHIICGADGMPSSGGSATVTVSGGTPNSVGNYSYAWSPSAGNQGNDAVAGNVPQGNHSVIITDSIGCTTTAVPFEIIDNTALPETVTATASGMIDCDGNPVMLMGSSTTIGVTYSWAGPNGFEGMGSPISVTNAGDYILTVTRNDNGCTDTNVVTVGGTALPVPIITPTPNDLELTCSNMSVMLSGSMSSGAMPLTYQWSTGAMSESISATEADSYDLTVTDANGCSQTASVDVTQNITPPTATIEMPDIITCANMMTVTLNASNSTGQSTLSYDWGNGNTGSTFAVSAAGTYPLTVTDAANDCTAITSTIVTENISVPTVNADSLQGCAPAGSNTANFDLTSAIVTNELDTSITYYQNSNLTSLISTPTNYPSSGETVYASVEFDDNGCASTAEITLIVKDIEVPQDLYNTYFQDICSAQTITVAPPNDLYNYSWRTNGNNEILEGTECTALNIISDPSDFFLDISDDSGCLKTVSFPINLSALVIDCRVFRFADTKTLFCNRSDFATYQWGRESKTTLCAEPMVGETFQDVVIQDLDTDTYYYWVIVKEDNGCTNKIYLEGDDNSPFGKLVADPNIEYGDLALQINPNPNKGAFELTLTGDEVRILDVHIYDALGRATYHQKAPKIDGAHTHYIAVPNLTQGVYFVRVTGNDGILLTEKIIVK